MNYIKELDSVRAIAAIIVIVQHWSSDLTFFNGIDGVAIFFVLSGFLITSILFDAKNDIESSPENKIEVFKNFFFRRALRILPLYYLVVFFVYITRGESLYDLHYYLMFFSNFYIYQMQSWNIITHLWSISVEEQFYLAWPIVILLIDKRYILHVIIATIGTGILFQLFLPLNEFTYILTPACLPALGLGALLSYLYTFKKSLLEKKYKLVFTVGMTSLGLLIINSFFFISPYLNVRNLSSIFAFGVIAYILFIKGENGLLILLLRRRSLMLMGKISYGLYVYHHIIPFYTTNKLYNINAMLPQVFSQYQQPLIFLENSAILLIISILSYKFFESPILKLKKHFKYSHNGRDSVSSQEKGIMGI